MKQTTFTCMHEYGWIIKTLNWKRKQVIENYSQYDSIYIKVKTPITDTYITLASGSSIPVEWLKKNKGIANTTFRTVITSGRRDEDAIMKRNTGNLKCTGLHQQDVIVLISNNLTNSYLTKLLELFQTDRWKLSIISNGIIIMHKVINFLYFIPNYALI